MENILDKFCAQVIISNGSLLDDLKDEEHTKKNFRWSNQQLTEIRKKIIPLISQDDKKQKKIMCKSLNSIKEQLNFVSALGKQTLISINNSSRKTAEAAMKKNNISAMLDCLEDDGKWKVPLFADAVSGMAIIIQIQPILKIASQELDNYVSRIKQFDYEDAKTILIRTYLNFMILADNFDMLSIEIKSKKS